MADQPTAETTRIPEALAEIRAILKKYDMAAIVHIADPPMGEALIHLDASWSCMRMEGREFICDEKNLEKFKRSVMTMATFAQLAEESVRDTAEVLLTMSKMRPFQTTIVKVKEKKG